MSANNWNYPHTTLSLNAQKCKFRLHEVKYVGNIFTSQGMLPDNEKVNAITQFPIPTDKKALQRLLGMANYLSRYIPNYTSIAAPLYELLHDYFEFQWETIINLLSPSPSLL